MTPEELLEGSRGRRVCLEVARLCVHALPDVPQPHEVSELHDRWRSGMFEVDSALDPGSGGVRFTIWASDDPDAEAPQPPSAADSVAAACDALERVPLIPLTPDLLLEALIESVDSARYWQPPDGLDVLAATPQVRPGLLRFARAIVSAAAAAWWERPVGEAHDVETEWIAQEPEPEDVSSPLDPPESALAALIDCENETRYWERRARAELHECPDGYSHHWWSKPPWGLVRTTSEIPRFGAAQLHLKEDSHGPEIAEVCAVRVADGARVFRIDRAEHWAELCRRYPIDVTLQKQWDWRETTGRRGAWVMPNWRAVAADWDAVHLSVAGYLRSAGTAIACDEHTASVIAGWDPDTTYWLGPTAVPETPAVEWRRCEPDTHVNVHAWSPVE